MNLIMTGISHRTAPLDIRERFYLSEMERELLLSTYQSNPAVAEVIVLSTCNRTEIYAHVLEGHDVSVLWRPLFSIKKQKPTAQLPEHFYSHAGKECVNQFLRVTAGLESIVLGENQILGQVKSAIELSRKHGMLGKYFNILSGVAVKAGKKAQSETQISYGGVPVSWAAVTKASRMLGTFRDKSILIMGAGKMGCLAASHLMSKGPAGQIYVMNRSQEKAKVLVDKFNGTPVSFWDIKEVLQKTDVCICSVGAPHYLLDKETVAKVMPLRADRPLLCVDISVPRNIDPSVVDIDNVSLITIDDLGEVVAENMEKRGAALSQVESIIDQKIEQYYRKITRIKACEETGDFEPASA